MNPYIGHEHQISGVEEHRLVGGKGDGMRLFEITNGKGMEMTVSPDRNGDISRLRFRGINMSYLSPCGYVAPAYYDRTESNWLASFTAGYLTTCGLQAVGSPCVDEGEVLPLHGAIANLPCEYAYWEEDEREIRIHTTTKDEVIFGRKLTLRRTITVSKEENRFVIEDEIENTGDRTEPLEILYHMNMGYPLLDEDSVITIPSAEVLPRILPTGCAWRNPRPVIRSGAITTNSRMERDLPPFTSRSWTSVWRLPLTRRSWTASWSGR